MLELKKKIAEVNARWADAASKQDFGALAACYTSDAAFFPPNAVPLEYGRESEFVIMPKWSLPERGSWWRSFGAVIRQRAQIGKKRSKGNNL